MQRQPKAPSAGADTRDRRRPVLGLAAAVLALAALFGAGQATADTAPTPTIAPPANVQYSTAHLAGEVNPNGGPSIAHWRFEWSTDHSSWTQGQDHELSQAQSEESTPIPVEEDISGLSASTTYFVRLAASNEGGENQSGEEELTTKGPVTPPSVTIDAASLISAQNGGFAFTGHVNPNGTDPAFETSWHFSCEPSCGNPPGGTIAPDESSHLVEAEVEGLEPKTTYTVTLHASNAGGEETAQATFKTPAGPPVTLSATTVTKPGGAILLQAFVNPRNSFITDCHFAYGPTASYGQSASCVPFSPRQDTVQSVTVRASAGDMRLSFEGDTTPDIPYGASAATVQEDLRALPSIGPNVSVADAQLTAFPRYAVTFEGPFSGKNVPALSGESGTIPLSGFDQSVEVSYNAHGTLNEAFDVAAEIQGLTPGTVYHWQLVATTAGGTVSTADANFRTPESSLHPACSNEATRVEQHSTFLPDCRAFEQVSPADKRGGDVASFSARTRASASGEAVQYASLSGFGDVKGGGGAAFEYLAQRGPSGWVTHAINPTLGSDSFTTLVNGLTDAFYQGEFSSDFSQGVYGSPKPLAGTPATVKDVPNLYLRGDLESAGAGDYRLLTACPYCAEAGHEALTPPTTANASIQYSTPKLVGASPDMGHVLFESTYRLTADGPAQPTTCDHRFTLLDPETFEFKGILFCRPDLYEWDHGILRSAGILPDGTPADISIAGLGGYNNALTPHVVSDGSDGHSRIFFTQPTDSSGRTATQLEEEEGSFGGLSLNHAPGEGNIFMRVDHSETVKLNASERTEGLPSPFAPATYLDASADGERVFFMSEQPLTNDAVPGIRELYMYDATKPPSDPHNLTLLNVSSEPRDTATVEALIGTSKDGHYVYFVAAGQLLAGGPVFNGFGRKIYLWHNGRLTEIGPAPGGTEANEIYSNANFSLISHQARVTPDGRHLLFTAGSGFRLGGYEHSHCFDVEEQGCRELYVYSADSNQVACVSCNPSGAPATASATVPAFGPRGGMLVTTHQNRAISADGHYVFFSTAESLVPGDTNGKTDAYEYDTETGEISLLSSGTSSFDSYFLEADESGENAFITTRQPLTGSDTDESYDLYDVRIGGGFREPAPNAAGCAGEACQGSPSPAPAPAPVGSATGDRRTSKHHRGHKKRRHKARHHRHRANANRRAGK